jgi:predicted transcriptional regulator
MLAPFALDTIAAMPDSDFSSHDLKEGILHRYDLNIPVHTLDILLSRLWKKGTVRREGGKNFRALPSTANSQLATARQHMEEQQRRLAQNFRQFADNSGERLTEEDALALLLDFFDRFHVYLLLGEEEPSEILSRAGEEKAGLKLVARYIERMRAEESEYIDYVQSSLEGYIIQNALLMKGIDWTRKNFKRLEVFFDTGFLFAALGLTGPFAHKAAQETLEILKATKAQLCTFKRTAAEMQRILKVYENHLGTNEGIQRLYPTDLTRFFVTHGWTPSDVKELIALLEEKLNQLGFTIKDFPPRDRRYNPDDESLTQALRGPGSAEGDLEPRVVHDVDAVAAIITLRRGTASASLDDSRAVFATTSGKVIHNVRGWYRQMGDAGIPPVVSVMALSNAAWLKKPTLATTLKLDELCALCAAALRPSRRTWDLFLVHLRKLKQGGEVTSDEAVAVVASSLTDSILSEVEDDMPIDAATVQEVVDRVKQDYAQQAAAQVRAVEQRIVQEKDNALSLAETIRAQANDETQRRQRLEQRLDSRARAVARWIIWLPFGLVLLTGGAGIFLGLPFLPIAKGWQKIITASCMTMISLIWLLSLFSRVHLHDIRIELEKRLAARIRTWIAGE